MKVMVIGDIHFGVKCTIPEFVKYQEEELDRAIEVARKNKVELVVFLGDIFDNRTNIYVKTYQLIKQKFYALAKENMKFVIIVGNHDTFYKNTNSLNTPREVFNYLPDNKFTIVDNSPVTIQTEDGPLLFVPWMSKDNYDECLQTIENSPADYCFGHFEINGFVMNNNNKCSSNLKVKSFSSFKHVFSGHFHTRSKNNNITYVGSLIQMDWNDFGLEKGIIILDTKTGQIIVDKSPKTIYKKIIVGDRYKFEEETVEHAFLRVYINRKLDKKEQIQLTGVLSKNISYELIDNTILDTVEVIDIVGEDKFETVTQACIESQEEIITEDKTKVLSLINELYYEMKQLTV